MYDKMAKAVGSNRNIETFVLIRAQIQRAI